MPGNGGRSAPSDGRPHSRPHVTSSHVEAVLLWSEAGPSDAVREWFTARGLSVVPMRAGLLISGEQSLIESAFAVDLGQSPLPVSLPVPEALKPHVRSIAIPPLRRLSEQRGLR